MKTISLLLTALLSFAMPVLPISAEAKQNKGGDGHKARAHAVQQRKAPPPKQFTQRAQPRIRQAQRPSREFGFERRVVRQQPHPRIRAEGRGAPGKTKSYIVGLPNKSLEGRRAARNAERFQQNAKRAGQVQVPGNVSPGKRGAHRAAQKAQTPPAPIAEFSRSSDQAGQDARERELRSQRDLQQKAKRQTRAEARADQGGGGALSEQELQQRLRRAQLRAKIEQNRKQELAQQPQERGERGERSKREARFQANRDRRLTELRRDRRALRAANVALRRERIARVRNESREYWQDRAEEVRDRIRDRYDKLFDDDWWEHCDWRSRPVLVEDPWWWWRPAQWSSINVFIGAGWSEPVVYDYGADVSYDDENVYVSGALAGTRTGYYRQVATLANPEPEAVAEAPVEANEWTPLGVWALVQEAQGDAVMFFQLSVNKQGLISGAYVNAVSGEKLPVTGKVDKTTQKAAWHVGEQSGKVFEAGMYNLTQDQASCLIHFAPGDMQTWLLVRLPGPALPEAPTPVGTPPPA